MADGLRADMLSTAVSPVFNSLPASAFAQNVGLVAMTGITSRFVVAAGGVTLLALGLVPLLGRVVAAVPRPVLDGAGLVLFGTVAASGIRTLSKVDYDGNQNMVIVATALAFGVIPIAMPVFYASFPEWTGRHVPFAWLNLAAPPPQAFIARFAAPAAASALEVVLSAERAAAA